MKKLCCHDKWNWCFILFQSNPKMKLLAPYFNDCCIHNRLIYKNSFVSSVSHKSIEIKKILRIIWGSNDFIDRFSHFTIYRLRIGSECFEAPNLFKNHCSSLKTYMHWQSKHWPPSYYHCFNRMSYWQFISLKNYVVWNQHCVKR